MSEQELEPTMPCLSEWKIVDGIPRAIALVLLVSMIIGRSG